jgi:hypothetical protein
VRGGDGEDLAVGRQHGRLELVAGRGGLKAAQLLEGCAIVDANDTFSPREEQLLAVRGKADRPRVLAETGEAMEQLARRDLPQGRAPIHAGRGQHFAVRREAQGANVVLVGLPLVDHLAGGRIDPTQHLEVGGGEQIAARRKGEVMPQALEGRQEPSAACVPEISNEVLVVGADGGERLAVRREGEAADAAALAKARGPQARDGAVGQGIVHGLGTGGDLRGPCQDERCEPPQDDADHGSILWSCGLPVRICPEA